MHGDLLYTGVYIVVSITPCLKRSLYFTFVGSLCNLRGGEMGYQSIHHRLGNAQKQVSSY